MSTGNANESKTLEQAIMDLDAKYEAEEASESSKEIVESEEKEEAISSEAATEEKNEKEEKVVEEPEKEVKEKDKVVETEAEAVEYSPNFSYKVHDEERTFPEKAKQYIKSKEDEEFFRDLLTKSDGVDVIKPKLEKYRSEANDYKVKVDSLSKEVKQHENSWAVYEDMLSKSKSGDTTSLNKLLDILDIPDIALGQILAQRLEMTPEQKQVRVEARQAEIQNAKIREERQNISEREADLNRRDAEVALLDAFSKESDIVSIAKQVDSRLDNGYFLEEVKQVGIFLEEQAEKNGTEYPSYRQVFDLVADKYKKLMNLEATGEVETSNINTNEVRQEMSTPIKKKVVIKDKGIIPNIGNSNGESPIGKEFTSIADLEKEYDNHINSKK